MILKLIRSVDEGVNPDREILEFLTTHTSYRSVPALIGSIEYEASPMPLQPILASRLLVFCRSSSLTKATVGQMHFGT